MKWYLDVGHYQNFKHKQLVGGDAFLSTRIKEEDRTISVLSDGLGSGIKASVLATLTATMASRFISSYKNIRHTAGIIMSTLPVCKVRKINYSTFSIVDVRSSGETQIMEYDNPRALLIRNEKPVELEKKPVEVKSSYTYKNNPLLLSTFQAQLGDRILIFSDGVTQSGMGTRSFPLGWGDDNVRNFIVSLIQKQPEISSRELARRTVEAACRNDLGKSKDDTTCGVIYFRKPRKLLVITGPPIDRAKDRDLGVIVEEFDGRKILCGGTTANIIARELNRDIRVNIDEIDPAIPPSSSMPGIDLVTEGILTLARVSEILDNELKPESLDNNAARSLVEELLDSDHIRFVVGTKINEAHQDPNVPVELEIRRNVVKKIVALLETKYLKQVSLRFI